MCSAEPLGAATAPALRPTTSTKQALAGAEHYKSQSADELVSQSTTPTPRNVPAAAVQHQGQAQNNGHATIHLEKYLATLASEDELQLDEDLDAAEFRAGEQAGC